MWKFNLIWLYSAVNCEHLKNKISARKLWLKLKKYQSLQTKPPFLHKLTNRRWLISPMFEPFAPKILKFFTLSVSSSYYQYESGIDKFRWHLFETHFCAALLDPVFSRTKIRLFGLSRPCKAELDDNAGASMATSGGQDMKGMENLENPSPN